MTKLEAKRDAEFLAEIEEKLQNGRNGDTSQLNFLAQMLRDWRAEFEGFLTGRAKLE